MSNPGVLVLRSTSLVGKTVNGNRLQVEDNIGEAIHIHIGDVRFDYTIRDFLALSDGMLNAVEKLVRGDRGWVARVDPSVLGKIEPHLLHVVGYRIESIALDRLICAEESASALSGFKRVSLERSREYQVLSEMEGGSRPDVYRMDNAMERDLRGLLDKLRAKSYPVDEKHIVVFEGDMAICDGKKTAAVLRYLRGNVQVPVVVLMCDPTYRGHLHSGRPHIRQVLRYYLKASLPMSLRRALRRVLS